MEIKLSDDRLISSMGFPIVVRRHLYIESGPRASIQYQDLIVHTAVLYPKWDFLYWSDHIFILNPGIIRKPSMAPIMHWLHSREKCDLHWLERSHTWYEIAYSTTAVKLGHRWDHKLPKSPTLGIYEADIMYCGYVGNDWLRNKRCTNKAM